MSELDELKDLLFGAEKQALDSIAERVERRDVRAADVADILPEAIHQSYQKDGELVESLTDPIGECLQNAFRDDPETYGDALYPVMGPAIRKSIMHALRGFAQQINEAVEHSISPKGLKWRWQASRAGVPFGEYMLQKSLLFRVEQAYLISRENGLLVGHVHHEASKIKDSDAVSAMFTAIQDFVKESFSPDRTGRLESADMGEFTLWAVHGPHALLVCVIRGVPPRSLRGELSSILERIHFRYGEAIREYKGDTSSVPDVEVELERCLRFEARQEETKNKKGKSAFAVAALVLLLVTAAFFGFRSWNASKQHAALEAALTGVPGLYVSAVERDGRVFSVQGLRDPLAPNVVDVAARVGIAAEDLDVSMQAFQSLAPEMVATRAKRILGPPSGVQFDVSGTALIVEGDAPWAWQQRLLSSYKSIAGIETLDDSGLTAGDRERIIATVKDMNGQQFFFDSGITLVTESDDALAQYAADLGETAQNARRVGFMLAVALNGSTDGIGDAAANQTLARNRAVSVADVFRNNGLDVSDSGRLANDEIASEQTVDANQRYVQVELELIPLPHSP